MKKQKIKPARAYCGASRGRLHPNTCRSVRSSAAFLAGFAPVVPVMLVPLADYRELVRKARGKP